MNLLSTKRGLQQTEGPVPNGTAALCRRRQPTVLSAAGAGGESVAYHWERTLAEPQLKRAHPKAFDISNANGGSAMIYCFGEQSTRHPARRVVMDGGRSPWYSAFPGGAWERINYSKTTVQMFRS